MKQLLRKPLVRTLIVSGFGATVLVGGCTIPLGGVSISTQTQTDSLKASIAAIKDNVQTLNTTAQTGLKSVSALKSVNAYRTLAAGSASGGDYTLTWGDDNQLSRIYGPDLDMRFSFTGQGQPKRTASVEMVKMADGSTGTFTLEVEAPSWNKPLDMGDSRYQVWFNQQPDSDITYGSLRMALTPQGKADEKMDVTVGAKNFQEFEVPATAPDPLPEDEGNFFRILATQTQRIPTEIFWKGFVPKMAFDQKFVIQKGGATQMSATWSGSMSIDTEHLGRQDWVVNVTGQGATDKSVPDKVSFLFENTSQKFKFEGTLLPKDEKNAVLTGKFVSTTDGKELATVTFDSSKGDKAPTITYSDGSKELLALQ